MPSQLVAYSGFSAANYIQEPYSADLDYGTGEFSLAAWVSAPVALPVGSFPATHLSIGDRFNTTEWVKGTGWVATSATVLTCDGTQTSATDANASASVGAPPNNAVYRWTVTVTAISGTLVIYPNCGAPGTLSNITVPGTYYGIGVGSQSSTSIIRMNGAGQTCTLSLSVESHGIAAIADRSAASGPNFRMGVLMDGRLSATAFDGTTTRSVTTPAVYNNGVFTKARATYTAAGKLAITVNGVEVASATGTPLLSMNSRWNLLPNSETLDSWITRETTILPNVLVAPNGTTTADKIVEVGNTAEHWVYMNAGVMNAGTAATYSCHVKAGERTWARLRVDDGSVFSAWFDIANGIIGTVDTGLAGAAITSVGNGWYRIQVTRTHGTTGNKFLQIGPSTANGISSWAGDTTKGVYAWGGALEEGTATKVYQRVGAVATDFDYQATLTIGNSRTLDAPFPGSITLLKLGATVPTPEQATFMYEQEKQMFRPDAQITLPASSAVLDLAYDEAQDKWVAIQAGFESSFTGLIRTSAAVPSAGSFGKVVAGSGVKAISRTTSSPGVDIVIPAYGMREELVRRAEAAAKASKTLTVFDFDAIAAQTDFVLPVGWVAANVVSAGNTQREGATKNFTRLYDGFRETIRFAVAPGAGVWVRINAIKE